MKKLLLILLCLMLFPFAVNAKEYCKIVTGNGSTVGDEVQCGTESFYIVSNKNGTAELLSKYNLFVGDIINYIEVNRDMNEFYDEEEAHDYCMSLAESEGFHPYEVYYVLDSYDNPTTLLGCRVYEKIESEHVRQDSRAVGTKLDGNGHSILPLYGVTYMNTEWGYDAIVNHIVHNNVYDDHGDLVLEGSSFKDYIDGYKEELLSQNVDVTSVSFITLDKTLQLLKDISGQDVEVDLEYSTGYDIYDPNYYTGKMDIKTFTGNHKWVYDVTYWLGSGFESLFDNYYLHHNDYYISNEGMLCAIGRGECAYLPFPIGNGVRPLVTVPSDSIAYLIRTKTDGNGTIEVIEAAQGDDAITFKVTSKKGYKLSKLVITTDSGEIVEFNEGAITNNLDGTVSVSNNAFTMPYESVTIEARWSIANPKTGFGLFTIFSTFALFIVVSILIQNLLQKKKSLGN